MLELVVVVLAFDESLAVEEEVLAELEEDAEAFVDAAAEEVLAFETAVFVSSFLLSVEVLEIVVVVLGIVMAEEDFIIVFEAEGVSFALV